jgi:hypothetical protein
MRSGHTIIPATERTKRTAEPRTEKTTNTRPHEHRQHQSNNHSTLVRRLGDMLLSTAAARPAHRRRHHQRNRGRREMREISGGRCAAMTDRAGSPTSARGGASTSASRSCGGGSLRFSAGLHAASLHHAKRKSALRSRSRGASVLCCCAVLCQQCALSVSLPNSHLSPSSLKTRWKAGRCGGGALGGVGDLERRSQ